MSKTIGVIAEDASDVDVVNEILNKYMQPSSFSVKKFIGNGCGKIRNKCEAWTRALVRTGCDCILIIHDLDKRCEQELRSALSEKVKKADFPNSIIIIPTEEIEAWLLADSGALKKTFNLNKTPKQIGNCESIDSPKEYLRKLIWASAKKRYLNTVHNKRIAQNASIANFRRCRSYRPLDRYILKNVASP